MTYDYPHGGQYNETIATIGGREYCVNTQYAHVQPLNGATLDGIDIPALVADARKNGKLGQRPRAAQSQTVPAEWVSPRGPTLTEEMDSADSIY